MALRLRLSSSVLTVLFLNILSLCEYILIIPGAVIEIALSWMPPLENGIKLKITQQVTIIATADRLKLKNDNRHQIICRIMINGNINSNSTKTI
jgi:hypothetical protein